MARRFSVIWVREIAALVGATVGARLNRTPVILDGYVTGAAAAILHALNSQALDHCQVDMCLPNWAPRLLRKLGKLPLLALGMRLGEGSGAALAINILVPPPPAMPYGDFGEAGVSDMTR